MSTPHNAAAPGEIAKTVLMPGDPLRARFIAETYFDKPRQFNCVRGMLGYTGTYRGKPVSVMGSGMGMPSIGIYSYELYTQYGVEEIIRIGSAGAYSESLKLFDLVLATAAWSESSYAQTQNGQGGRVAYPSTALNDRLRASAGARGKKLCEGIIHSSDVFYREEKPGTPYWHALRDEEGCVAVEMESFALFHNAQVTGCAAACLVTISDSFARSDNATAQQRQEGFTDMMEVALGVL
jgi:purine-nucleoside phosphorylase